MSLLSLQMGLISSLLPSLPIAYVGKCTPATGLGAASYNLSLPAGSLSGDIVLASVSVGSGSYGTTSGPSGSQAVVNNVAFGLSNNDGLVGTYLIQLAAADITNGYVVLTVTLTGGGGVPGVLVQGLTFRGIGVTMLDVAASVNSISTKATGPFTLTNTGLTTVTDGAMLVDIAVLAFTTSGGAVAPVGFTNADAQVYSNVAQTLSYRGQALKGGTGETDNNYAGTDLTGWLTAVVALRPSVFALTGTLPGVTTGAVYSHTLALSGTFTAPVSIDASVGTIPAWLTPTVSGNTVTFAGTAPGSAETDSFTVRATDSSTTPKVATSAQSVAVSTVSPAIVQSAASGLNSSNPDMSLPGAPTLGNYLVIVLLQGSTANPVNPATTESWTNWTPGFTTKNNTGINAWIRPVVSGDTGTEVFVFSGGANTSAIMFEVSGITGTLSSTVTDDTQTAYPHTLVIPAGVSGALPIVFYGAFQVAGNSFSPNPMAGTTNIAYYPGLSGTYSPIVADRFNTLSTGSAISDTVSPNGTSVQRPMLGGFLLS